MWASLGVRQVEVDGASLEVKLTLSQCLSDSTLEKLSSEFSIRNNTVSILDNRVAFLMEVFLNYLKILAKPSYFPLPIFN